MPEGKSEKELVLIVEDDEALGTLLLDEVQDSGLEARWTSTAEEGERVMEHWRPDVVVCDLRLPGMDGLSFLNKVQGQASDSLPGFLIITAFGTISKAVEALKAGAEDFLTKPLDLEHFMLSVKRILERKRLREVVNRMKDVLPPDSFHGMYGKSTCMRLLFEQIRQVADSQGPVLILGESGSGKELVTKAIHNESSRANGPFLPVNCAGIPEHLVESEFFGHAAGSFTGAQKGRQGLFAEAQGGSLLLDEISEMPLFLQAKLLRILQDGKIRRVGENREYQVDVRVLAATHRDLEEEVRQGRFREDLFFRLETFTVRVPPLRERGDDVELLASRFMQQFTLALNKKVKEISSKALDLIVRYPFPGNVRELSNAVERAVTFATGTCIHPEHLPTRIRNYHPEMDEPSSEMYGPVETHNRLPSLADVEQHYIRHVLRKVDGNKRRAAAILGIGRRTLYRRLGEKSDT
ncbi:MAG: sigma-54 dependent transcriptional regulator [Deltaproteobacteria bacterium]|nr:sigma-54 dependent transcriptional regulator [Deltaproteobacteria bacterium]